MQENVETRTCFRHTFYRYAIFGAFLGFLCIFDGHKREKRQERPPMHDSKTRSKTKSWRENSNGYVCKRSKNLKIGTFFPHALSSRRFISASKVGNRTRPSFSVAFLNGGRKSGRAIKFRSQRGQSADRERWLLKSGTPTLWQFELQSGGKIGAIFLMFLRSLFVKNAGTYRRLYLCESQNSRPASIFSSREIMWKLFQN